MSNISSHLSPTRWSFYFSERTLNRIPQRRHHSNVPSWFVFRQRSRGGGGSYQLNLTLRCRHRITGICWVDNAQDHLHHARPHLELSSTSWNDPQGNDRHYFNYPKWAPLLVTDIWHFCRGSFKTCSPSHKQKNLHQLKYKKMPQAHASLRRTGRVHLIWRKAFVSL